MKQPPAPTPHRRYSYRHRTDLTRWGVIDAPSRQAVVNAIGPRHDIEAVWLTDDELAGVLRNDRAVVAEIVECSWGMVIHPETATVNEGT